MSAQNRDLIAAFLALKTRVDTASKAEIVSALASPSERLVTIMRLRAAQLRRDEIEFEALEEMNAFEERTNWGAW